MSKGWVKMYRKMVEWEHYKDIATKVLFFHLLLSAAYEETENENGFIIHSGYVLTSIRQLADETGLTVRQVRTSLEKLEATHEVTRTATHKSTLIKLEKWAFYQAEEKKATQTATQQTTHFNIYNNNIYNTKRNTKNTKKKSKNLELAAYTRGIYDFEEIEKMELEKTKKDLQRKAESL